MREYDLIIIGGGPAGMTAGIYASRLGMKTILITKDFGGQMAKKVVKIENYPGFEEISGQELIERMKNHLFKQKIETEIEEVVKVEKEKENFIVKTKSGKEFFSKTVIVASGGNPRPLLVPGEKEFLGKGVSYCAVCDGPLFKGKKVAVIGGGNAGFESAIYLAQIAEKVYILEYSDKPKADAENQERAFKTEKVELITNARLKEIRGKNFVEEVVFEDMKTKEEKILKVSGVFVEIGTLPATSFVKDLVDFNQRGEIIVEPETYQTKTPGLFAAGDCNAGKYKQIVTAAGEGAKAALAAYDYLQNLKK